MRHDSVVVARRRFLKLHQMCSQSFRPHRAATSYLGFLFACQDGQLAYSELARTRSSLYPLDRDVGLASCESAMILVVLQAWAAGIGSGDRHPQQWHLQTP